MSERKTMEIAVGKQFDYPAEIVYDAWLDEKQVGEWLFATPNGSISRVVMDARIGGGYLIVDKRPEGEAEHFGEYVQLKRPRLIEFTFSVDRQNPGNDRVLIEIIPKGDACDVTLHHWMDANLLEFMERTREGWMDILLGLECTLGHPQKTASP